MPHIHRDAAGRPRRALAVGGALALVAVVAIAVSVLGGGDDEPSQVASGTTTTTTTAAAASGPSSATGPAPDAGTITWTGVSRVDPASSGGGCEVTSIYTMTIDDGARFAGAPAVVMRFGPDYPGNPTESFVVGADGTFEVPYEARTCVDPASGDAGVALVSVDGDDNLLPPPPA